jgi:hypothetical protein
MLYLSRCRHHRIAGVLLALACAGSASLAAQVVLAPASPVVGSSNPATAEPPLSRPSSKSCTVTLFQNLEFADFNTKTYSYTPPSACPGPWAKVIFSADFTVTAGRQYDRTGQFYLGGANIFYGTTAEPRSTLSPSWHVERDVSDLSAIFKSAQTGTAILGNYVGEYAGVDYSGIIYANAQLTFYQADRKNPAAVVPSVVIGLPGNSGAATLSTSSSVYSQAVTLPLNVTSAYLDVIAQSQSNDEFWYLCVPDALTGKLQSCGSTGFRETEITIDGTPAGVAPVYPWIYTGGIDPYLWEPIPGLQALNLKPYRVDLSPFAAVLSDGNQHTVGIQVFNADSYFAAAANLLVFTDPDTPRVTGAVTYNSLDAEPSPTYTDNTATDADGNVTGSVVTSSTRDFAIEGYINTQHGRVETSVKQKIVFDQTESFNILADGSAYLQDVQQKTTISSKTSAYDSRLGNRTVVRSEIAYPFSLRYDFGTNADGSMFVTTTSTQKDQETTGGGKLTNTVSSSDTLNYDASGNYTGHTGSSAQSYVQQSVGAGCYSRKLTSANLVLTGVTSGADCRCSNDDSRH